MKKEIEELKTKCNNSGNVDEKQFEEIKRQNGILLNKVQEAKKKIELANSMIGRAKKYSLVVTYVSQLLKQVKPSDDDKQAFVIKKLSSFVEEYEKEKATKKHE